MCANLCDDTKPSAKLTCPINSNNISSAQPQTFNFICASSPVTSSLLKTQHLATVKRGCEYISDRVIRKMERSEKKTRSIFSKDVKVLVI